MGGNALAVIDGDVTISLANPSVINPDMHNNLAFSFVNYFTGVNFGYAMYSRTFEKAGSFVGSFQFIEYGKITAADETGTIYGEFGASEFALSIGWGRALSDHFTIGANGKLIYSQLEKYNSFGIAVDVAGSYFTKDKQFTASLIARNVGTQIVPYRAGEYEPLPIEVQIALSERLKHIPLRFSLLYTHLERWDLAYTDPYNPDNQADPVSGEVEEKSGVAEFADNFMRHIVLGSELTIAKVFSIRIGYNYQRRQELKLYNRTALSGFSYGFGFRVKMFNLSYTRATYMAGPVNPNYITVAVNLQQFGKK
jgi:hypothetical protein